MCITFDRLLPGVTFCYDLGTCSRAEGVTQKDLITGTPFFVGSRYSSSIFLRVTVFVTTNALRSFAAVYAATGAGFADLHFA